MIYLPVGKGNAQDVRECTFYDLYLLLLSSKLTKGSVLIALLSFLALG